MATEGFGFREGEEQSRDEWRGGIERDGVRTGRSVGASARLEVPKFSGERSQYERWRKKMSIWLKATKTDEALHGALIIEAIRDDEVSDLLLEIEPDRLASADGSRLIFGVLDKKFLREAKDRRYATLLEMLELSRDERESMEKYLERKT